MGRGGRGRGGGDPISDFFKAVQEGKDQTIYYHVTHGGLPLSTRNEDGRTGLMVAAMRGEGISLSQLLRSIRKDRTTKQENLDDQDKDGMTALMLACRFGHTECVQELMDNRAGVSLRNEDGATARDLAVEAGHRAVVKILDGEESSEEEDQQSDGVEGETGAQRRKRIKEEKAKQGGTSLASLKKSGRKGKEAAEETGPTYSAAEPVLSEVKAAVANVLADGSLGAHELLIEREDKGDTGGLPEGHLDFAIWRCTALRRLQVRWKPGLRAEALEHISALRKLQTLILRDSRLPELHAAVGQLPELKSIDLEGNALKTLPMSLGNLKTLESFTANRNSLSSLAALSNLTSLQLVSVSGNKLASIDDFDCGNKLHIHTLQLSNNVLEELPDDIAEMSMLQTLDVSGNRLSELPHGMGSMKEKKFTTLILDNNPIKDGKIRNMVERAQDSGTLAKDVIKYLQKQKPQKGGKKSKKKKTVEESEDEVDEDEAVEDPVHEEPLPMTEEPSGGKKSKKKKKGQASGDAEFDPPVREANKQDADEQEECQDDGAGKKKSKKKKKGASDD